MAKKRVESIVGMADEGKLTVQKSVPLHALWKSDLTLAEFKILDMYLARIDSHKPEKRQVKLSKGEVEQALGVTKISTQNLKERLKHLMGNVVEVQDRSTKKGFRFVTLFEEAAAEQDNDGLWEVRLECTQKAMKYFFNIESLGYFRYKLRCITSLTSRYTYVMFSYLEAHRRMGLSWEVSLDELKQILACDQGETYKEYKRFNDLILKKVQKELHEKTECRFSYEAVKKGRSVVSVRFALAPLERAIVDENFDPNQYTIDDYLVEDEGEDPAEEPQNLNPMDELVELLRGSCNNEFTAEEVMVFHEAMNALNFWPLDFSSTLDRADFLRRQYRKLCLAEAKTKITHRYKYLLGIIQKAKSAND